MAEDRIAVIGLASDDVGSGHYRLIHPVRALSGRMTHNLDEFRGWVDSASVLLLQRVSYPGVEDDIRRWRRNKLVVYELDDLIHDVPRSNPNYQYYRHGSPILVNATKAIVECDGVIVSSYELERYYRRFNMNIVRIPNFIDFRFRDWCTPFPKSPDRLLIGWSGGSQHQQEVPLMASIFSWLVKRYRHVDIGLYCHPSFVRHLMQYMPMFPVGRLVTLPVRPFSEYPYQLGAFDIAIAPLENTQFNRARCLHADTAVWGSRGVCRIGDLRPGDWVWNGEKFVHVLAVQRDGWTVGINVYLENGLSVAMTSDHRVLTSIGWLNAGKLRRGDFVLTLTPYLGGRGERVYEPVEAARILGKLYAGLSFGALDGVDLKRLKSVPVRRFFSGWGIEDARVFLTELIDHAPRDRRGVPYMNMKDTEFRQCVAELALACGRKCVARWNPISTTLLFPEGDVDRFVRVSRIRGCWLDTVDIQVEGEVFAANGIASHNSSLKPLEYMARGVVTVASDIAEYRLLYKQGAPLYLARDDRDWRRVLSELVENGSSYSPDQISGWVRDHYDLHDNVSRYLHAFDLFMEWKREGRRGRGEATKLERGHACPCGSGEKYGRCCHPTFG